MRQLGKKGKQWLAFRKKWLFNHPPNHEGFYTCYICKRWIKANEVTLDHIKSRSRHPELVFDEDNMRPCCYDCNFKKGSRDLEEI